MRAEVLAAHDAAVDAALGWFERHGAVTRRGRDGRLQVDTRGVTAAVFRQHTSRAIDPQLHTHAIDRGEGPGPDRPVAGAGCPVLEVPAAHIGWVYDAALRSELTGRLGVAWVDRGDGVLDLACVPEARARGVLEAHAARWRRSWTS